jgi:hypothetical protein
MMTYKAKLATMKKFMAIATLCCPQLAFSACPADLAIYSNLESKEFSLSLSKQKDPKAWSDIEISISGPNTNLHYELTESNGYARSFLVKLPVKENEDGTNVVFFDKKLRVTGLPQSGRPAPAFIFSADLGVQLYYGSNNSKKPIFMPTGMWKLSGCAE